MAATGSAHHQPNRAFSPMPPRTMIDSHQQAVVWNASASSERLPSAIAVDRFARASHHITPIERLVTAIPTGLGSGRSCWTRVSTALMITKAASRNRESATSFSARRSSASTASWSLMRPSARSRQMSTDPEALSTKLSMPKPSSATLPAASAAAIAMTPSTRFHPTVRYSRRSARASSCGRVTRACSSVRDLEAAAVGGLELEGRVLHVEVVREARR